MESNKTKTVYKLIDGRDRSFEIFGDEKILEYLGYPAGMDMDLAADRLNEENDGMFLYRIIEVEVETDD